MDRAIASRNATGDGWWMVDWPDADNHFSFGVQRLTRIATGEPHHFSLTDNQLWDHPWIYATQTGWWGLSDAEIKRLGEYLLRGGYLVTDDFWGPEAWEVFRLTMDRVLPGRPITEIALDDKVMHSAHRHQHLYGRSSDSLTKQGPYYLRATDLSIITLAMLQRVTENSRRAN